jgi:hypothetical protein
MSRIIKPTRMEWTGHVTRMGERRIAWEDFGGKARRREKTLLQLLLLLLLLLLLIIIIIIIISEKFKK